jgi:pimeloyl-ACP methyl ester carboxylesterase
MWHRLLFMAALWFVACSSPVGVRRIDPVSVQRGLTANVLSSSWPSAPSLQLLTRLGLYDRFFEDPSAVLVELRADLPPAGAGDRVFALSELSFFHAMESGRREYFLAAAVYAYALLFPGVPDEEPLSASDPRLRLTYDLYNRALTEALAVPGDGELSLEPGRMALPWGELVLEIDRDELMWLHYPLESFMPAADFAVHGLRNRYRWPGVGAPLVAGLGQADQARSVRRTGGERIAVGLKVAVTAFLRLPEARRQILEPEVRGSLELYSLEDGVTVEVDGRDVPLELETSSSLAYTLDRSPLWDFEIWGFLQGAFRPVQMDRDSDGLFFLRPYRPGRIPVVLVHGTASSPARWAELINELENDPEISPHFQIWLFLYNTGNPIGYSGARLRTALQNTVREVNPEGRDDALRRMVVIGHSQGGLLTKLTAIDSGTRFWDAISRVPFDEMDMNPETREFLARMIFVKPEPFVKRVVFVATPHRGSYLAGFQLVQRLASRLVALPTDLMGHTVDFVTRNKEALALRSVARPATSIDQMSPSNPFLEILASIPVAPGITANSIIPVATEGPIEEGNDGVVEYTSAHLAGVESELVVRSGHSTQAEPATINEIRRILLVHRAQYPAPDPTPPADRLVDEH